MPWGKLGKTNAKGTPEVLPVFKIFDAAKKKKGWFDRLADELTNFFGTVSFLFLNILFFLSWILINLGFVPGVSVFDPYPFNLITTAVSLEAIVLSIIVLMSQKRASHLADIREQIDFEVNVQAEKEITKILNMLDVIQHELGVDHVDDPELVKMKRDLNIKRIEERIRKRIAQQ